jgi:hypothetical protein
MHRQFNLMYVTTLKVVKNHHTIVLGPKFTGIAQFGNIATDCGVGGGGGTSSGGSGGKGKRCPPLPEVDNETSSDNSEDE